MKSNRFSRFLAPLLATVVLMAAAGRASGQCTITGPSEVCGSPATLCGPDGSEFYVWTYPDGSMVYGQCITVSAPGSYSLRFIDPITGDWAGPCSRVLTAGPSAPVITGGTNACSGETLELCGPTGDFDYDWAGPDGMVAATACVSASVTGNYQLRVRTRPDGCWSAWSDHAVSFTTCEPPVPPPPPPPPPPPAPEVTSCPRPSWWWSQQCPDHDQSDQRIDPALMAAVGACVASHDADLRGGFCRTMLGYPNTLETRARRQVATAWANVCAGELDLTTRDGRPVSLDPAAAVSLASFQGTVASWLETAQGELLRQTGSGDRRAAREAYKRVIRVGWHINRGIGIGPVCPPPGDDLVAGLGGSTSASPSSLASSELDPEPLAAELIDDSDAALSFGTIQPNPFVSEMSLAYAITTPGGADVTIGVYDLSGRLVRELVRGPQTPGTHVARWDGRDADGAAVRGGMYFVLGRLDGARVQTRVTLVR